MSRRKEPVIPAMMTIVQHFVPRLAARRSLAIRVHTPQPSLDQRLLQLRAEHLEGHCTANRCQRITALVQTSIPVLKVEKSRLTHHIIPSYRAPIARFT
jgi:hypothetical protein